MIFQTAEVMVRLSQLQERSGKTDTRGGHEHEEYDGSKQYADVWHVLYVFDMFGSRIIRKPFVENHFFLRLLPEG